VLTAILKEKGYKVDTASCGKEAIDKSFKAFYNMALIDMRLPDMEGTQLLTALRETTPKMVKIIITGYPSLQNAMAAVNKNADAYVLKPVNMENVLQLIDEHLKKQEAARKYAQEKITEFFEARVEELEEESTVRSEKRR